MRTGLRGISLKNGKLYEEEREEKLLRLLHPRLHDGERHRFGDAAQKPTKFRIGPCVASMRQIKGGMPPLLPKMTQGFAKTDPGLNRCTGFLTDF
jgi:hypothetical protein